MAPLMSRTDDADPLTRRRAARAFARQRLVYLGGGAVAGAALLAAVLAVAFAGKWFAPAGGPDSPQVQALGARAGVEGENWNHAELLAYLNGKGLDWVQKTGSGGRGPTAFYFPRNEDVSSFSFPEHDYWFVLTVNRGVYVTKCDTPQEAKDAAGTDPAREWYWGRWHFASKTPALLATLREQLR